MAITLTEKVRMYLEDVLEAEQVESKSRYFQYKSKTREEFYFVGNAGAVRVGSNASNSISITRHFLTQVEEYEKEHGPFVKARGRFPKKKRR